MVIWLCMGTLLFAQASQSDSLDQFVAAASQKEIQSSYETYLTDLLHDEKYWYSELQIFKDTSGTLSFEDILSYDDKFEWNNTKTNYPSDKVYWAKLMLRGNPEKGDYYLFNIANDAAGRRSWLWIEAYLVHENGEVDREKTGFALAKEEKAIPTAQNMIRFSVEQGEKVVLYVRLKGVKKILKPGFIQFGVVTENWWSQKNIDAWRSSSLIAVLVIQFLYFLLLFFIEKERVHLYFSLAIFGVFIEYGSRFLNEFSTSLGAIDLIAYSGIPIFLIGITKYTAYYFNVPKGSVLSKKTLPAFISLCCLYLVIIYSVYSVYLIHNVPPFFIAILTALTILIIFMGAGLCGYMAMTAAENYKVYRKFYLLSFTLICKYGIPSSFTSARCSTIFPCGFVNFTAFDKRLKMICCIFLASKSITNSSTSV